jgi:thymidylate kinase
MIYIFEGMDNCLKDTLIQLFRSKLSPQTQILKYNSPPAGISDVELWQKAHFEDMFELMKTNLNNSSRNLILNRAHLGEYVYSPIYRGYEGEWIFDLEKSFLHSSNLYQSSIKLFVFYDSDNSKLLFREDGNSFSNNNHENFDKERKRFIKAFEKSMILNKRMFDLSDYPSDSNSKTNHVDVKTIINLLLEL